MTALSIGTPVRVGRKVGTLEGEVAYLGEVQFAGGTDWVGVRLTGASAGRGKNDGSVAGVRYFEAGTGCGVFVRERQVEARPARGPEQTSPVGRTSLQRAAGRGISSPSPSSGAGFPSTPARRARRPSAAAAPPRTAPMGRTSLQRAAAAGAPAPSPSPPPAGAGARGSATSTPARRTRPSPAARRTAPAGRRTATAGRASPQRAIGPGGGRDGSGRLLEGGDSAGDGGHSFSYPRRGEGVRPAPRAEPPPLPLPPSRVASPDRRTTPTPARRAALAAAPSLPTLLGIETPSRPDLERRLAKALLRIAALQEELGGIENGQGAGGSAPYRAADVEGGTESIGSLPGTGGRGFLLRFPLEGEGSSAQGLCVPRSLPQALSGAAPPLMEDWSRFSDDANAAAEKWAEAKRFPCWAVLVHLTAVCLIAAAPLFLLSAYASLTLITISFSACLIIPLRAACLRRSVRIALENLLASWSEQWPGVEVQLLRGKSGWYSIQVAAEGRYDVEQGNGTAARDPFDPDPSDSSSLREPLLASYDNI